MGYEYVKMLPWVGEKYAEAAQRVMVVGVKISSSDPGSVGNNETEELVEWYLQNQNDTEAFEEYFSGFHRIIDTIREEDESRVDAWRRIIFYNFTQEPMIMSTAYPDEAQVVYGVKALEEIIDRHRPDKIIVIGKKLFSDISRRAGERGQDFGLARSLMIRRLNTEQGNTTHTTHLLYFNDPFHPEFDNNLWRDTIRKFLGSQPEAHVTHQNRRNISQILRFIQLDGNALVISNKFTLLDVLSRAVNCGILHLDPSDAIPSIQRIKAGNIVSTAYYASVLRDKIRAKDTSHEKVRASSDTIEKLLMIDNFEINISKEGDSITFTEKKKNQAYKIYDSLLKMRRHNSTKRIEWKVLEELFNTPNLRQYIKDIRRDKEYIKKIDSFFNDRNW